MGSPQVSRETEQDPQLLVAGRYLVEQDVAAYSAEQHAVWGELVRRRMPQLQEHACREYLQGFEQIGLRADRLPELRAVSARLAPDCSTSGAATHTLPVRAEGLWQRSDQLARGVHAGAGGRVRGAAV